MCVGTGEGSGVEGAEGECVLWSVWLCTKKNALRDMGRDTGFEYWCFPSIGGLIAEGNIIPSLYV